MHGPDSGKTSHQMDGTDKPTKHSPRLRFADAVQKNSGQPHFMDNCWSQSISRLYEWARMVQRLTWARLPMGASCRTS